MPLQANAARILILIIARCAVLRACQMAAVRNISILFCIDTTHAYTISV